MERRRNAVIFGLGGLGYLGMELCWRGRTHWTMFFLGGTCFWLLSRISRSKLPFLSQTCLGMASITSLELLSGLLLNRALGLGVWDYSGRPFQFMGQICLGYSLLWLPVSAGGLLGARGLRHLMGEKPEPIRWL